MDNKSRHIILFLIVNIIPPSIPGKGARFEITVPKGKYRFTGTGERGNMALS